MQMKDMVLLHQTNDLDGETHYTGAYGPHLLMDCHDCDRTRFTRESISEFMTVLVEAIGMDAEDFHFWDDEGVPDDKKQDAVHAVGTSAGGVIRKQVGIQFIITSSIVIHTLDLLRRVYVDIFSCKLFDDGKAVKVVQEWFNAGSIRSHLILRN